jgi:ribosome-interacting GTPase 1
MYKPCLVDGNKMDLLADKGIAVKFSEGVWNQLPVLLTSCLAGQGMSEIGEGIFRSIGILRVYTKEPNQSKPSSDPFVIHAGTTVRELARSIHNDLAERYRYSRIWGPTSRFAGEQVGPEHVLGDGDIVEIHAG